MSEAVEQTCWLTIPGCPGRHLRVRFLTEVISECGAPVQETTTALDIGSVLEGMQNLVPRRSALSFTRPEP